jgi:hypothetical protein
MSTKQVKQKVQAERPLQKGITDEAYAELESIVGAENASRDDVICQGYTGRGYGREVYWYAGLSSRPAAIVLPKNSEEIQKIVQMCVRRQQPYTVGGAFWLVAATPVVMKNMVVIDTKRASKVTIDEKNMYAVVEGAPIIAQLAAECYKRDLYHMVPGGGGQCAVIGNFHVQGQGIFCYRMNPWTERRCNGAEWVTPEGDLVTMGSLQNGEDSANIGGDPGPELIGLIKGQIAWFGCMGITTKLSLKLYPFQPEGFVPDGVGTKTVVVLPPRVRYQNYTLPTEEDLVESMLKISREQICGAMNRVPAFWRTIAKAKSRQAFWDLWDKMTYEEVENTHILRVLFIGYTSLKQLEYDVQVVDDIIVKEHGGTARRTRQTDEGTFLYSNVTGMWSPTGFYASAVVGSESARCTLANEFELADRIEEEPYKSIYLPEYRERPWYSPFDFRRALYTEFMQYPDSQKVDPLDRANFDADLTANNIEWMEAVCVGTQMKHGFHGLFGNGVLNSSQELGPTKHNYHIWIERIHNEFDPMNLANPPTLKAIDALLNLAPWLLNEEYRQTQKRVANSGWKEE